MEKRDRGISSRLVAALLILISGLMLFMPWLKLDIETSEGKFTPEELSQMIVERRYPGSFRSSISIFGNINELAKDYAENGVRLNTGLISKAEEKLKRGRFSLLDMTEMFTVYASYVRSENKYLAAEYGDRYIDNGFSTVMSVLAAVLWVLLALVLLCYVLAFTAALHNNRKRIIPCISAVGVLVLLSAVGVLILNKIINGSQNILDYIYNFTSAAGVSLVYNGKQNFISIGIPALLSFIFIFGSFFALKYMPDKLPLKFVHGVGNKPAPEAAGAEGQWRCRYCGRLMGAGDSFCASCGYCRYTKLHCAECGTLLMDDEVFCPECGARRPDVNPGQYVPYREM